MSTAKPKVLHARRSFLEPLRVPPPPVKKGAAAGKDKTPASALSKLSTPTSTLGWLQLASHLLITTSEGVEAGERVLNVCEEAAALLLEEDAKKRADAKAKAPTAAEAEAAAFSPREGGGGESNDGPGGRAPLVPDDADAAAAAPAPPSTERLQAAYLLTAAAVAAAEAHRLPAAESAMRLARSAVEAYQCPMTACTLAMTCVRWGTASRDLGTRTAAYQTALTVMSATCQEALDSAEFPVAEAGYLLRMAWMMVGIGAAAEARAPLTAVLQSVPRSYMGLLLLSLLHAAEGDFESASSAVMHLLEAYPDDVVGVVVHAAVQHRCRLPETASYSRGQDAQAPAGSSVHGVDAEAAEELAVAMARVAALAEAAASPAGSAIKKKSLKGLCTHCAPDEEVEGGPKNSTGELRRRVVGHWALLGHVATRLGCSTIADVASEAGTTAVSHNTLLYRRSFAALQCSHARLTLQQLRAAVVAQRVRHTGTAAASATTALLLRDMNLLAMFDFDPAVSADASDIAASLALTSGSSDNSGRSSSIFPDSEAQRLVPSKQFDAVAATLLAAVEACPHHAEGHTLLGVTRLLEASQPDLPPDTRHNRLQEAARHFLDAVRADASTTEAYLGAGIVAEAQGAIDESFDFYASAAEVAMRAPLIPWSYFDYLYQ